MQTHPKWKYAVGKSIIVDTPEEEEALEGEWFDFPEQLQAHLDEKARAIDEALRAKRAQAAEDADLDKQIKDLKDEIDLPDIETLRATATEMGLEFHARTGAKKLSDMIKAAIEAKGE